MRVESTKSFIKSLRRLDPPEAMSVVDALTRFAADPDHPGLNFEPVTGQRGLYTIRATLALRVFLRRNDDRAVYEIIAVGSHDLY